MKEYEIERSYRDVRLNRIGAGTDEIMLDVIGRVLRALVPGSGLRGNHRPRRPAAQRRRLEGRAAV